MEGLGSRGGGGSDQLKVLKTVRKWVRCQATEVQIINKTRAHASSAGWP